jgi:hypothetical protein
MRMLVLLSLLVIFCVSLTAKAQNPAEPAASMQDARPRILKRETRAQASKQPHHKQL